MPHHPVLSTPELLDHIFSFLCRDDNAATARVCRMWTDPSRDHIWSVVDKPCELFRLLSPISVCPVGGVGDETHRFVRQPTQSEWNHFLPFSRRVRELSDSLKCAATVVSLLEDIIRTQPSSLATCFPRLVDLQITIGHHLITPLLHHHIKVLGITAPVDNPRYPPYAIFDDIVARSPGISTMIFWGDGLPEKDIEGPLCTFFPRLPLLESVAFSLYDFTTSIANTLLNNGTIKLVHFTNSGNEEDDIADSQEDARPPSDIVSFSPVLKKGLIRALTTLELAVSFSDTVFLFSENASQFPHLCTVTIRSLSAESEASARSLFDGFGRHLPWLTTLSVISTISFQALEDEPNEWSDEEDHETWSFDTLRGILNLKHLQSLKIAATYPLMLNDQDMATIAKNLCQLASLFLNPIPRMHDVPQLTLHSLTPLAEHCPRLKTLGLYLDARTPPLSRETSSTDVVPFTPGLALLRLNASPVDEQLRDDIVLFLSRLLYPQTTVKTTFPSFHMDTPIMLPEEAIINTWVGIEKYLRLVVKARQEERDRAAQHGLP
ncbi:hypothetical protein OF83DRAFT_1112211 [Amylostereum chailletii]|nr:hypothetical protein OF83DRAFT_1112211 [Amylostereum chailletii]